MSGAFRWVHERVRALSGRWWWTAKTYGRFAAFLTWRRRPEPIVVFQMGKVASSTIAETLEHHAELAGRGVAHVHFLDRETLRTEAQRSREHYRGDPLGPMFLWDGRALRRRLLVVPKSGRRWDVVTLVRDPVARNVSAFFQVAHRFGVDPEQQLGPDELLDRFLHRFPAHDAPLNWFDAELQPATGIDVYDVPFDHSAGFQIYEGDRARVLLIRLEDLPTVGAVALGRFFGVDGVELRNKNLGDSKEVADLYRRFLDGARLPEDYLDEMYGSTYAQHFYTAEEISGFRRKWGPVGSPR